MKLIRVHIPLQVVKLVCMAAVIAGIFFFVAGSWIGGLCLLLGAYIFERSRYRCPHCNFKLDMKHPVLKSSHCPACMQGLGH